jgi:hypothetical protein
LAHQLLEALDAQRTETKDPYVTALFDTKNPGYRLLERIVLYQDADPSAMVTLVDTNKPPVASLFQSVPESVVPPKKN